MFKNREVRIQVAKKNDDNVDAPTLKEVLTPDSAKLIEETGRKMMKNLAITVVAVVAAIKLADTLSEIAVKKTKSADEK